MPNNITNILIVQGDTQKRKDLFEAIKSEDHCIGSIDFSKIIPPPNGGSDGQRDWNIDHWGTKWNSYGFDEAKEFDGETLEFQTAWATPQPVITALAEQYPDLDFDLKWADEDFGYNVGHKQYKSGKECFSFVSQGGSNQALELAAEIHQVDLAESGFLYNEETGKYEYVDPDEPSSEMEMKF